MILGNPCAKSSAKLFQKIAKNEAKKEQDSYNTHFIRISSEYGGSIVYDSRTGVQYWRSEGAYNNGTLTVLLDTDGKPLIYKGLGKKLFFFFIFFNI